MSRPHRAHILGLGLGSVLLWHCAASVAASGPTTEAVSSPEDVRIAQGSPPASRDALFGDDLPKAKSKEKPAPSSRDALFGDDVPKATPQEKPAKPGGRDALFGDDLPAAKQPATVKPKAEDPGAGWRGYVQAELAYTYPNPEHWSKARTRMELGRQGRISDSVKYKVTGRVEYDAVFDIERNFYPPEVKNDQRRDFQLRETYLDVSAGDWEFRFGRQHIIWGEVPGLFFADVVSAKDLREFVLPEFDGLRIPQWAARAEYFAGNYHLEAIWIPYVTVDRIGKPGADFFPFPPPPPPGFDAIFLGEQKPSRKLSNSNVGLRASTLTQGWDLSAFVYRSIDTEATFYRDIVAGPTPTFVFRPRHDRITQIGGTLAKDLGEMVLKSEAIYNRGKGFSVQRLSDVDGIARLDFVDYLVGLDFALPADLRLHTYFFHRHFTTHDPDIVPDRNERGLTFQISKKLTSTLEAQALFITSLNRSDWMFRPRVTWNFAKNWRMNVGADVLHGPPLNYFGQFADKDRVYADVRYSF